MILKEIKNLVEFLENDVTELETILSHLVLKVLHPLNATSAMISEVTLDNFVQNVTAFGISNRVLETCGDSIYLHDKFPKTDAIKDGEIILVNSLPDWPVEYTNLRSLPHPEMEKSYICFPIEKNDTPFAVIGIYFMPRLEKNESLFECLDLISSILSPHLYKILREPQSSFFTRLFKKPPEIPTNTGDELTTRQEIILSMVAKNFTNAKIGDDLGYSESTIRQEVRKIYQILKCAGRSQAIEIFFKRLSSSKNHEQSMGLAPKNKE
jgi:DNA-binding CsgD family transcriptional regulator